MPSKRQQQAGYLLPEVITGHDLLCVTLKIPDAPEYRQAFIGHLFQLSKWYSWHKTYIPGDTTASEAAEYWRGILMTSLTIGTDEEDCGSGMGELRTNPEDACQLQYRANVLDEWETIYDACDCECEQPTNEEWPEDGGRKQVSFDNGETWEDADYDERFDGANPPPYGSGDDPPCTAAENITAYLKSIVDEVSAAIVGAGTVVTITALVAGILAIIFTGGAATPLVFSFVTAMLTLGSAGIAAAFTEEFWEELKCLILCALPADGVVTQSVYDTVLGLIAAETGAAWDIMHIMFALLGSTGMNRAAHAGGVTPEEADCADCGVCEECVYELSTVGASGFGGVGTDLGEYAPGVYDFASANVSGNQWVQAWFGTPSVNTDCCRIAAWEAIEGGVSQTDRRLCGSNTTGSNSTLIGVDLHMARWVSGGATPFIVRVTIVPAS